MQHIYYKDNVSIKFKSLQKPQQTTNWWSSTDSSLQSPEELPPQTFKYEEHSKQNHPNYLPRSESSLESSSKASRNLTNHKSVKLYGFKSLKHRRTSTINLRRRRTYEEHEEREEQRISNKLIARDSLQFCFNNLQSIPQPNWRISCVHIKITLLQIQSTSLLRRLNQRITLL